MLKVPRIGGGAFGAPPRPRLGLQTPASDRVKTPKKQCGLLIQVTESIYGSVVPLAMFFSNTRFQLALGLILGLERRLF